LLRWFPNEGFGHPKKVYDDGSVEGAGIFLCPVASEQDAFSEDFYFIKQVYYLLNTFAGGEFHRSAGS